jgi:hypothetical protein
VVRSDFGVTPIWPSIELTSWTKTVLSAEQLDLCPDDETAMEYAKQFVEGHDVELWQHDFRITTFKHKA